MALWSSLSSMLKRQNAPRPEAATGSVQQVRTRARQRLIGALLLLTLGVIGFPLLFESRPRPIPIDIPIDIPARDATPPLAIPDGAEGRSGTPPAVAASSRPAPDAVITETPADAGRDVTSPEPPAVASRVPPPAAPVVAERAETAPDRPPADRTAPPPPMSDAEAEAARAQALLEGRPVARASAPASSTAAAPAGAARSADPPRYIIQVGAFTDPSAVRETRMRVERLGLKTYTQVAETPAGPRTRVRVGPFAARAEADRAMARVKAAGVAAAILTL